MSRRGTAPSRKSSTRHISSGKRNKGGSGGGGGPRLRGASAPRSVIPRGRRRRIVTIRGAKRGMLRRPSRAVPLVNAAIRRLIADMAVTMRHARGVGLAAVQIGVPLRVIVADTGQGLLALVNPRLRRRSGTEVADEGCLSIPGVVAPVRRARRVAVDGTLLDGRRVGLRASGYVARILQHEIDHLNGVLILDRTLGSAVRRGLRRSTPRRRPARRTSRSLAGSAEPRS